MNWTNVKSLAVPVGGTSRDVKRVSIGGTTVWEKSSPLPYDSEVEYLESTGTQWIDTGYIATEDTRVVATLYTNETGNRNWFGGSVASADLGYVVNSYSPTAIELRFGNSKWQKPSAQNVVGKVFTIDFGKSAVKINGDTIYTPSYTVFGVQTIPIAIFVRYGGTGYIKGRVYSFQIYENGILVRDYIPVRKGTVGYLYDRVSGQLFGNAGTGAFSYGGDLPYPIGG